MNNPVLAKTDNTEHIVEVEALSHDGRGIAHIKGKVVFIDGALPGETVSFVYRKRLGKYDEAKVVTVLQPSPDRVIAKCAHFGICGGCSLQHLSHAGQLRHKQELLLTQLKHFGGLEPAEILEPVTGPQWQYRHKARLGVKFVTKKNMTLVGFREKNSHFLADLSRCEVLAPPVDSLIEPLKELINQISVKTQIPQIEVAIGDQVAALIFRHLVALSDTDQQLLIAFGKQHQVDIYLQPGDLNSIHCLWPDHNTRQICNTLPEYNITHCFMPNNFSQVNPEINKAMIALALKKLDPQPNENVLDLFCGFGNFTLPIAKYCASVVGIEGNKTMVQQAEKNAEDNQISNVSYYAADLSQDCSRQPWALKKYDKILLDPPRTGAQAIIQLIEGLSAQRIVYISCNPATLARDAGMLVKSGRYRLMQAGILDMFPHTSHVESMAIFEKCK